MFPSQQIPLILRIYLVWSYGKRSSHVRGKSFARDFSGSFAGHFNFVLSSKKISTVFAFLASQTRCTRKNACFRLTPRLVLPACTLTSRHFSPLENNTSVRSLSPPCNFFCTSKIWIQFSQQNPHLNHIYHSPLNPLSTPHLVLFPF